MRHELRSLVADRSVWLVIAVFALTIGYAVFNGATLARRQHRGAQRFLHAQESKTRRFQERAGAMENYINSGHAVADLPRHERYEYDFGPLDPRYASAANPFSAVLPPPPLAPLTVGLSDLFPVAHTVSWWNLEMVSAAEQTESPLKLLTGNFDLAFVMLYLLPLFILALCFNLFASEKESGTLSLLLSQPINLYTLLAGKIIARALLIFLPVSAFTVAGCLLSGLDLGNSEAPVRLLGWMFVIALYGAFWFGLAVAVNGIGKSAASNAMTLIVCWLALLVVVPTAANLLATALYAVPSRAEFIDANREIPIAVEEIDDAQLRAQFFKDHPEFPADGAYSDWGRTAIVNVAKQEEGAQKLRAIRRRFDGQLSKQQALVSACGFLSPAILAQAALYDIAGAGTARYRHYLSQADAYNREWKANFWPAMFTGKIFSSADYDRIPRFSYQEERLSDVARRAAAPLFALLVMFSVIVTLGIRAYRRYPIV
jgi:ABC-2 type transport system permease protein